MQVHQLAYFVAVARERHFTRAAESVGTSQPNLSKQIRSLENALGTPLFHRTRGRIDLTPAGEALLPFAQRMVIDLENADRAVAEVAALRRGRVRLGATPSLCAGMLPDILSRFHARHPQIVLEIHEAGSRMLAADLEAGELDLALLVFAPESGRPKRSGDLRRGELRVSTLLREPLVVVGPPGAAIPGEVTGPELEGLPLVLFREGYDLRDVTLSVCAAAGFEPQITVEGGEMGSVLRFVEAGLGYAVVPEMVLATHPDLSVAPLGKPQLSRAITLAHRDARTLPLAARAFRDELVGLFDDGAVLAAGR